MIDAPGQMTLGLRERRSAKDAAREDAAELVRLMEARPAVSRASTRELCVSLGWNDRRLRAAAEASDGEVLSAPGVEGYRLARLTPVESYMATERARYRSQIEQMTARLLAMDKAVHGRGKR